MAIRINKNPEAQKVLTQVQKNAAALSKVQERLASGMRITKPSDDAAGLAIASALNARTRVYTRAIRNIDDGMSVLTIADSALQALTEIVTRQLELAEQAANGSLTREQRLALDEEAGKLTSEFNRIIESTKFNNFNLLDNSTSSMSIQAGIGAQSAIQLNLTEQLRQTVGSGTFNTPNTVSTGASTTPISSASADLDGDGDIDIVTANSGSATMSVMLNNGSGVFSLGSTLNTQDRVSEVRLGDFNEDGIVDILGSDYGATGTGTTVTIFLGNGNGTFQAGTQSTVGIGPSAAAIGDVNNDGEIDVITTTATINFISGLPEITTVALPTNGVTQTNTVVFTGISQREVTSITAAAVGVREVSELTTSAVGIREVSSLTAIDAGVREVSSLTAIDVAVQEVSQLDLPDASSITSGQYFTISSGGTDYYVWFNVDGAGGDPTPGGTGIQVAVSSADTADQVATAVAAALTGSGAFSTSTVSNSVTVTNTTGGAVTDAANGNVGGAFAASTLTQGTNSALSAGDYFTFATASGSYYVWFRIDGAGVDPAPGGTGIAVDLDWGDSAATVAAAIAAAIDPLSDAAASAVGASVTITNAASGNVTDIADGTVGGAFSTNVDTQGTNSALAAGDYFTFSTASGSYYAWFRINGTGVDPAPGGTGVAIDINWGDSAATIASAIAAAIDPLSDAAASAVGASVTITNAASGNVTDIADGNVGGAFSTNVDTQGTNSPIAAGDYFTFSTASGNYYVWFRINGTGVDPTPGGTGIVVDVNWGDSAASVATAIAAVIDPLSDAAAGAVGSTVTITNSLSGNVTNIADGNVGAPFSFSTTTDGTNSPIAAGDYFTFDTPSGNYYAWFRIAGTGVDPAVGGRTGVAIDVTWGDSANTVAAAIAAALDPLAPVTASAVGSTITLTNVIGGSVTDAADANIGGPFAISVSTQGTSTGIGNGSYFTVDTPSTDYYVWFNINGTGVDPAVGGRTGIQVNVNWGDSATSVAAAVAAALDPLALINSSSVGATTTIAGTMHGVGSVATGTVTGLTINTTQTGVTPPIVSGQYFLLNSSTTSYYVWYNVDGAGGDPAPGGLTGIQVNITTGQSATSIATATAAAIDARPELAATSSTGTVTVTDANNMPVTNASNVNVGSTTVSVSQNGGVSAVDPVTDTVSTPNHGLVTGNQLQLTTSGTLPGGLSTGTTYYAIVVDSNTLRFATSLANALSNTYIDITSFGVGTHSLSSAGNTSGGSLVLGNGDGTFQSVSRFPLGFSASSLQLADVNNDGNLDLLGSDNQSNTASVLLGNGDGSFGSLMNFAVGTNPYSLQTGDFNHDGNLDIAVADYGTAGAGTTVSVLLGDGSGQFGTRTAYTVAAGPRDLAIADVNSDGNLDIVAAARGAGAGTTISVLLGNEDGTFQAQRTSTTTAGPIALTVDDYNGDGVADVATIQNGTSNLTVLSAITEFSTKAARVDLTTVATAREAFGTLNAIMARVYGQRASIGASQSRLMTARSQTAVLREETFRAHSRIVDLDIAQAVSEFVARKIREGFGISLLKNAALSPQVAIDLIKNAEFDD